MSKQNLEARLARFPSPSHMLQNANVGPYMFPIPPQYTNWIEEVRAWRNGAVLLNQSYQSILPYDRPVYSWCRYSRFPVICWH